MENSELFISYSRRDLDFVNRLVKDLTKAEFGVWRDAENITPGTINWEKSIREAIKNAKAVVLVASPDSLQSDYVQGELAIARHYQLPIYPIWANGNEWVNCIPLDMMKTQRVDARNGLYSLALTQLTDTLRKLIGVPDEHVKIHLPAHDQLSFDLSHFPNFASLLNKTYMFHLNQWYPAFTYGQTWVLGNIETRQLAIPWDWLYLDSLPPSNEESSEWSQKPPITYNITPGSAWGVWDFSKFFAIGVALNDSDLADRLLTEQSIYIILDSYKKGFFNLKKPNEINSDAYSTKIIIGMIGPLAMYGVSTLKKELAADAGSSDLSPHKYILVEG